MKYEAVFVEADINSGIADNYYSFHACSELQMLNYYLVILSL